METDVPWVFAASAVRANAARQAMSAAGDGATAATRADQYISELRRLGALTYPPLPQKM